jgi:hypothetical protein
MERTWDIFGALDVLSKEKVFHWGNFNASSQFQVIERNFPVFIEIQPFEKLAYTVFRKTPGQHHLAKMVEFNMTLEIFPFNKSLFYSLIHMESSRQKFFFNCLKIHS